MSARVARLRPPGPWWYLAVCEACGWADMSWKHKAWAEDAVRRHNSRVHREDMPALRAPAANGDLPADGGT